MGVGGKGLIAAKDVLTDDNVSEWFQAGGPVPDMALYPKLSTWPTLGTDSYPTIVDLKGGLTGGTLVGGLPEDFKEVSPHN